MAKKRLGRRAVKQELKSSSKSFAKFAKSRVKDLAEEICGLVPELKGTREKAKGQKRKENAQEKHFSMLGFLWPVLSALVGILCMLFTIVLLNIVNIKLENYFVTALAAFFYNNLYLFFAISLFFGYADYLKSKFSYFYWVIDPLIGTMAVICILWIFVMALNLATPYPQNNFLIIFSNVIYLNLEKVFFIFLVLGYLMLIYRMIIKEFLKNKK